MNTAYTDIIKAQTQRALWEVKSVILAASAEQWSTLYYEVPFWKHVYHTLHSLDQWFINPQVYEEPKFHINNLNNLDDKVSHKPVLLSRQDLLEYLGQIEKKVNGYLETLTDENLLEQPDSCRWNRFTLIMAQHRHLHTHMGMLMGFIVMETGEWPEVLGLEAPLPQ